MVKQIPTWMGEMDDWELLLAGWTSMQATWVIHAYQIASADQPSYPSWTTNKPKQANRRPPQHICVQSIFELSSVFLEDTQLNPELATTEGAYTVSLTKEA